MKKLLSVVLLLFLLIQIIPTVYADETHVIPIPDTMTGYVIDDHGVKREIVGKLVSTVAPQSLNGKYASTYAYDVSMSSNADAPDSGFSSHVYLTVYYLLRDGQYYLLTNVAGHWDIEDYRVTVTESTIDYVCSASGNVTGRHVSNHFNVDTEFEKFTDATADFYQVRARLNLTYKMGTSRTWKFTLNNNII